MQVIFAVFSCAFATISTVDAIAALPPDYFAVAYPQASVGQSFGIGCLAVVAMMLTAWGFSC